ncbi:MAG TPA: DUF2306 domain-containing protein [Candidatus Acidoferrales bacterium]|nr:DUF2306 domain-containing protein [Candidatus Acidoferrales bacterium]
MAQRIAPGTQVSPRSRLRPNPWLSPKYLLFGFVGLMLAYVLVHDESFLVNAKDPEWQHIQSFRWWLLPHGLAGACAILLGATQFSERLRRRHLQFHRIAGYAYIACAFIVAPFGVYIQHANEPLGFARSFTIETVFQGGLWMLTTAIALAFILKGNVRRHREWMVRSFGTGPIIFLEVRVIGGLTGWENLGPHANEIIVWACTLCSIFIADLVLSAEDLYRSRSVPTRAAVSGAPVAEGAAEFSA